MAIAVVLDFPHVTAEQYATARAKLGDALQPGNLVHIAGPTDDGWRVIEVWESPEALNAFFQSTSAAEAFQAAAIPPTQPAVIPIHTLVAAAYPKS